MFDFSAEMRHIVRTGTGVCTTRPALTVTRKDRAMAKSRLSDIDVAAQPCALCGKPKGRAAWEKPNEVFKRQFCSRICSLKARTIPTEDLLFRDSAKADSGCIEWTGYRDRKGYGRCTTRYGEVLTHRISYIYSKGPIPKGLHVLHSCDNPSCINPEHLRAGTNADNMADRTARNRQARLAGKRNPNYRHGRCVKTASAQ